MDVIAANESGAAGDKIDVSIHYFSLSYLVLFGGFSLVIQ
jgi:hypothetical protein